MPWSGDRSDKAYHLTWLQRPSLAHASLGRAGPVFIPPLGQVSDRARQTCTFVEPGNPTRTHLRGGHAKGRKNGSSLTHNAQPTFPEARTTTSWLRFFRAEASYHSEALWDFAHFPVRMCQVSSPGSGATSGRWRRPEMHVSEADQAQGTLSRAGAVARIVPEAEGDGATVTRFCPRWRGRAAAGVAAAAA